MEEGIKLRLRPAFKRAESGIDRAGAGRVFFPIPSIKPSALFIL